ncbi:MAG: virulence protein RhuM/Fic/DOC family protein [Candidatus Moraniibacteriota bacterium]|nr:MAG: virulence protein RhuM/Fic/DOC family protein [Candidatus Moranbacteria bacterium]
MKTPLKEQKLAIYQAKDGGIELREDVARETVWASLDQIALLFGRDKSVISRHIRNVFKEEELMRDSVVAFFATTARDKKTYRVEHFNLDMILSVGYRVNSKIATQFRKWATRTLKRHITQGYTLNKNVLARNKAEFLRAIEDIKALSSGSTKVGTEDILELVKAFSGTWFSLRSYDEAGLPRTGSTKKNVTLTADELYGDVELLKKDLAGKGEATELFAQEKYSKSLEGILGNVMQAVFGKDAYETVEEKAAHLLYFVIKNHPFTDGNKRAGAFSFVWFLRKSGIDFTRAITPETLTTLALLIAESKPSDKDRMIGLVLLLLRKPS